MEKKRVFLAFSNAADQEDLIYIKSLLKKYDVEIVQFENGNYDKNLMLSCDYIFLVVPRQKTDGRHIFVGRGQYDQIEYLDLRQCLVNTTFLFYNNFKESQILSIVKYDIYDSKDYKLKYGRLTYDIEAKENDFVCDFLDFLMNLFSIKNDHRGGPAKDISIENADEEPSNKRNIKDWLL